MHPERPAEVTCGILMFWWQVFDNLRCCPKVLLRLEISIGHLQEAHRTFHHVRGSQGDVYAYLSIPD